MVTITLTDDLYQFMLGLARDTGDRLDAEDWEDQQAFSDYDDCLYELIQVLTNAKEK